MGEKFHVDPHGAALDFDMGDGLSGTKLSVGPMDNNAYILRNGEDQLLIDAAAEPERLHDAIGEHRLNVIVTTHQHHDHIGALGAIARAYQAPVLAGAQDAEAISEATGVYVGEVWTGDKVEIGDKTFEIIGLVGHTPGSIVLVWRPTSGPVHLFTGDSLFPGGVGKTGSPEDFDSLLNDVSTLIFDSFDDDTIVHPGHGDATTLGAERSQLDEWRSRGW